MRIYMCLYIRRTPRVGDGPERKVDVNIGIYIHIHLQRYIGNLHVGVGVCVRVCACP